MPRRLAYYLSGLIFLASFYLSAQNNDQLISVGSHSNGVSIGEPVVYNKGKVNIGFLNRFKPTSFSAEFFLSQDTLCQDDATQIVLVDSAILSSKRFILDFVGAVPSENSPLDSIFTPSDTGQL